MKLYGYSVPAGLEGDARSRELVEVTLNASSAELRRMSEFLAACADEMDRMGSDYSHVHLSDRMNDFRDSPHFVVMPLD